MLPVCLNQRIWAGGKLEFKAPLHVGEPLRWCIALADTVQKPGVAGEIITMSSIMRSTVRRS
jgi:hydroxyacyl-ACP dehydratase HTD2-like protein with hotdog domain